MAARGTGGERGGVKWDLGDKGGGGDGRVGVLPPGDTEKLRVIRSRGRAV